ncbi:MAG: C4-dicarboxylate transporter substrate-binding protein [Rhodospirillales bacterium]|nr:C4-dicarboxylate transporter substrate-binding protein [Rhodospirillales bacterium]
MIVSRRRALALIGAGLALSGAGRVRAAGTPRYHWKFGHVQSTSGDQHLFAVRFGELLDKYSNGDVVLDVYPSGQLGSEADLFQQVRGGATEFSISGTAGLAPLGVKEALLFDLPYFVTTREQGWSLLNGEFGDWFRETIRTRTGVHSLGFLDNGFINIVNRARPINTPDDAKGLKLRVQPAPGYIAVYEALGIKATPMAYTEVYQGIQQGVIDGLVTTPRQVLADKFIDVAKHYSFTRASYNVIVVLTNEALMKGLPPEIQAAVTRAFAEAIEYQSALARKMDEDAIVEMKKIGMQVTEPDLTPFISLVKPSVWQKLEGNIPDGKANIARLLKAASA